MGWLKQIFWPDHPDERAARKDASDVASRAQARMAEDQTLQTLWNRLSPIVKLYGEPNWIATYEQRPVDTSSEYSWHLGNLIQELSMFQPLNQRVPADIAGGMPPNVKRSVVRDYWASVTYGVIDELTKLMDTRDRLATVRAPDGDGLINNLYMYADRFGLYELSCFVAEAQVTRALWNEDAVAQMRWSDAARIAQTPRRLAYTYMQDVLQLLAEGQPDDFQSLGYTSEMLAYFGVPDLDRWH